MSVALPFPFEFPAETRVTPVRVLLADRPGPARRALAALLDGIAGVELTGVAHDRAGIATALHYEPADVLVIDDRLLGDDDHVFTALRADGARLRIIVVGVDDDPAFAARARRLGAETWLAKDRADERLPELLAR